MTNAAEPRTDQDAALRSWLKAIGVCGGLVIVSMLFVDRPLAEFAAANKFGLRGAGFLAGLPGALLPLALTVPIALLAWPGARTKLPNLYPLAMACSAAVIWTAAAVEVVLKGVFGRPGPLAWTEKGAFGFHWLAGRTADFRAFPSGEAALTMALISVLWPRYPQWRWVLVLGAAAEAFLLVALEWHFVSDVFAGGIAGMIGGAIACRALLPPDLRGPSS